MVMIAMMAVTVTIRRQRHARLAATSPVGVQAGSFDGDGIGHGVLGPNSRSRLWQRCGSRTT